MAGRPSSPPGGDAPRETPDERTPSAARPAGPRTGGRPLGSAGSVGTGLATLVGGGVVAGLLAAGLAVPVVATAGAGADTAVEVFEDLPTQLDPSALPVRSTIRYADGSLMTTIYSENRVLVPLDAIAPVMRDAVVSIEDSRFYEHGGADPQGIARAFVNNLTGGATQGASTLTQQWIKNVLLQQAREAGDEEAINALITPNEARKVREIRLAIAAEEKYSKDQVLENYLNIALFGANTYGVEAASEYYFGHPAAELSLEDAALLAGMIQNPSLFEPTRNPQDAQGRRDVVLGRMLELGKIDQAQHDAAVAVPIGDQLVITPPPLGCSPAGGSAYFCDFAVKTILADPAFGETRDDRVATLYRGGIDVTTTLDIPSQQAAEAAVEETVPADDPSEVGATIVSVQPGTGRIVSMAENRRYVTAETGSEAETNLNYNTDFAMGGSKGFQPGSNWKPFTLATWLMEGNTLRETVPAAREEVTLPLSSFTTCEGNLVGEWSVKNSEGSGTGRMSVLQATYDSVNTAYASMAQRLDLCAIRSTAESLGAHPSNSDLARLGALPANILGSNEVAPLTMAAAYATFASGGTYCPPRPLETVLDRDGQPLQPTVEPGTQPLATADHTSADIANTVTYALRNVFTEGTASRVGRPDGRPAAGKTGTTDHTVHTWFSGYTPQLATTAWVGQPKSTKREDGSWNSLSRENIDGKGRRDVYGSTYAAPMWRDYMEDALEGQPVLDFDPPAWDLVGSARSSSSDDEDADDRGSSSSSDDDD